MRVLCVDDDPVLLRCVSRILGCITSDRPIDPTGVDACILDWEPYGPEMVMRCQAAKVPYIVLTGSYPKALELRTKGVITLTKPWIIQDLKKALEAACQIY